MVRLRSRHGTGPLAHPAHPCGGVPRAENRLRGGVGSGRRPSLVSESRDAGVCADAPARVPACVRPMCAPSRGAHAARPSCSIKNEADPRPGQRLMPHRNIIAHGHDRVTEVSPGPVTCSRTRGTLAFAARPTRAHLIWSSHRLPRLCNRCSSG